MPFNDTSGPENDHSENEYLLKHLESGERKRATFQKSVDLMAWLVTPVCALLSLAGTEPYMMYSLYHTQLQKTLGLTAEQAADVQSYGTVGGLCLAFIPGIIYDHYGYGACLLTGSVLATIGAGFWYGLLVEGGAPGSPSWHSMAASFLMLGLGTRFISMAGVCAVLDSYPTNLAPRLSAIMSLFSACGALAFPVIWRVWYLPKDVPVPEDHPDHPKLMPVAHFHLLLVVVYIGACLGGLSILPLVPKKQLQDKPSFATVTRRLLSSPGMAMLALSFCVIPCVYEYLGSAMAPLGGKALTDAGVEGEDAHHAQAAMTTTVAAIGLAGRCVFGVAADRLIVMPGFETSMFYWMYFVTSAAAFCGFTLLMAGHIGTHTSVQLWSFGTYLIALSFSGFFSLLAGSIRLWFPKNEIGTWFGAILCVVGVCNFAVARLAAAAEYAAPYWSLAMAAAAVTCVTLGQLAYVHYCKDKERIREKEVTQVRPTASPNPNECPADGRPTRWPTAEPLPPPRPVRHRGAAASVLPPLPAGPGVGPESESENP